MRFGVLAYFSGFLRWGFRMLYVAILAALLGGLLFLGSSYKPEHKTINDILPNERFNK